MIKNIENYSNEEQFDMFVSGIYEAMCLAGTERNDYLNYKKGMLNIETTDQMLEIMILNLLEKNGFSIDELGTFLYKDIIKKVMECLEKTNVKEEELLKDLSNAYSQFYFDLSRNDRDMGLKTFHDYIQSAIYKMNPHSEESWIRDLADQKKTNYGVLAFDIASSIIESKLNQPKEEKRPKTHCLEKMSGLRVETA